LIKHGYDNEDNIRKRQLHVLLERLKWFDDQRKKELEAEAKNRFVCPLVNQKKKH